jgi:hypothetical protein
MSKENKTSDKQQNGNEFIADVSHSMTGDGMNCLEFFDMIKKEWCFSEEQYICPPKEFWNDVLTDKICPKVS